MASTYLSKTYASSGDRRTFTVSCWVKRSGLGALGILNTYIDGSNYWVLEFNSSNQLNIKNVSGGTTNLNLITSAVYRDTSAWYHIVVETNTLDATESNRVKLYINGEQVTSFGTATYPSQNTYLELVQDSAHAIGTGVAGSYFDGSMAHFHLIDGTAYDADTFGQTNAASGIWTPKAQPSVTYGTNGFFLKFANSGSLGTDSSGNGNNFTVNGSGTQTLDTPSNVFATMNPLQYSPSTSFTNGNLSMQQTAGVDAHRRFLSTLGMSQGKWYWEVKSTSTATNIMSGISDGTGTYANYIAELTNGVGYYGNGSIYKNNTDILTVSSISNGDIVNVALDLDNNYIYFGLNGTYFNSGDPTSGSSGTGGFSVNSGVTYFAGVSMYINNQSSSINFGNGYFGTTAVASGNADGDGYGIFEYAPPTGYYALCTKNINTYG